MKLYLFFAVILFILFPGDVRSQNKISEDRFIHINGIDQWLTIHGDKSKPVILFLHGGPGSPLSPYSQSIYKSWEKDFIIVQWDQRGTGKTYGLHAPEELDASFLKSNPLTVERMTSDGILVTEYVIKYLKKVKVILYGSSWGSVLGISMAAKRPELFYAYVGHSQIVDPRADFPLVYNKVYKLAKDGNDSKSLDLLTALGPPPYDTAKNYGKMLRIVKKFEAQNSVTAPENFRNLSPVYISPKDEKDREDGDDYSFINYVGDKLLGITPMTETIHFSTTDLDFRIPVYILQGEEDILTSKEFTKPYFDKIRAPVKKYYLIPGAAHGFNQSVLDVQYKVMKDIHTQEKPGV